MPVAQRYRHDYKTILRDTRSLPKRFYDSIKQSQTAATVIGGISVATMLAPEFYYIADIMLLISLLYVRWFFKQEFKLPMKMPSFANMPDPNNPAPGKGGAGKAEGILFLGNDKDSGEEIWITNNDARTHILYLGTTGSGKTEGLKALVTNALSWGSGFVYIDGKADTDLWGSLFSLARRFGRDDDILVLNYMTGNSDLGAPSNSMNPFASGSASYLTNLLVNLMDDSGDDNAMWKGRAIALLSALMPGLTWKRDNQGLLLDIGTVRDYLTMQSIIKLSRDPALPDRIIRGLQSYLDTLPGYIDEAFDDEGNEVPLPPDRPPMDLSIPRQQHGYLAMQFTRALQSLADEYGYIFKVQLADINLLDVVLNRRILIVLIPALEKSADEAANLGKIVAASLKGMMGSTLGAQVEGDWGGIIENKMTRAPSPFMTVFDEVGYYTSQGMAVMAAQARSLGFSLVFAAQDLPALEKRVKEEARSITGNCNVKIFGKLEDPTDTKDFFDKTIGDYAVTEAQGYTVRTGVFGAPYADRAEASIQFRKRADYDTLKSQREGEAHLMVGTSVVSTKIFYAVPDKVKAMRVHRFLPVAPPISASTARDRAINEVARRMMDPEWTAESAAAPLPTSSEIQALQFGYSAVEAKKRKPLQCGALAVAHLSTVSFNVEEEEDDFDFDPFNSTPTGTGVEPDFDLKSFWETPASSENGSGNPFFESGSTPSSTSEDPFSIDKLFGNLSSDDPFATPDDDGSKATEAPERIAIPEIPSLEVPPAIGDILQQTAKTMEANLFAEGDAEPTDDNGRPA